MGKSNAQKQREYRQRKHEKDLRSQQEEADNLNRRNRQLTFFAEVSPGHEAKTCAEELHANREWGRALGLPDVQPGETLRSFSKRIYDAWLVGPCSRPPDPGDDHRYVAAFSRRLQDFDHDYGFVLSLKPFEETWTPPDDGTGDEPISVMTLPDLPPIPKG